MSEEPGGLDWFFHEVSRRGLMHAAGVYVVVCWFVVQLLGTVAPYFDLPEWAVPAALAVTFAALPMVLGAAWLLGGSAPRQGEHAPGRPRSPAPPARESAEDGADSEPPLRPLGLPWGEVIVLMALAFAGGALWVYRHHVPAPGQEAGAAPAIELPANVPRTALAVLPFETLGPDPAEEYFSHGVSEEIRSVLAGVPGLQVASRTSSHSYAGGDRSLRETANALGVGSVLEGSVRREGERLRVVVRLVDARSEASLYSETFDRRLDVSSLFDVESEIAAAVARALEVELGVAGFEGRPARMPVSLETHELYLLGLYHWNRRTEEELLRAADLFRAAAQREPDFALAYAGLANTFVLLPLYAGIPSSEAMPEARRAAEGALSLDTTLAEAHAALAFVRTVYDWDWEAAEAGFRRAIELKPSYATAHEWYGVLLDALGRHDEAGRAHARALELDPLSVIIHTVAGLHHTFTGDYGQAIRQLERALELRPDLPLALEFLGRAHLLAAQYDDAERTLRRWAEVTDTPTGPWAAVVRGVADPSRREGAAAALADLERAGVLSPYRLAQYRALAGIRSRALDALEQAHRERDFLTYFVKVDPTLASLRDEPRFRRIEVHMGLSPPT